ncbi:MAG: hypothetical protein Fur0037_02980 [Planctomycetota bacterium]
MIPPVLFPGMLSLMAVLPIAASPAQSLLRWRLGEGQRRSFVAVYEFVERRALPRRLDLNARVELRLDLAASGSRRDGGLPLRLAIRRMALRLEALPLLSIAFDSDGPKKDAGPLSPLAALAGRTFDAESTARGLRVDLPPEREKRVEEILGTDLGSFLEGFFPPLPVEPVAIGQSWRTPWSVPGLAAEFAENRVEAVEGDVFRVRQEPSFPKAPGRSAAGSGSFVFDRRRGLCLEASSTLDLEIQGERNGFPDEVRRQIRRSLRLAGEADGAK